MAWQNLLRDGLLETAAYPVPEPDGRIKLDAMENPHTWPADMRDKWLAELATLDVNRYPDAGGSELKKQLRSVYGISDEYEVLLGNGSDELIQIVTAGFARPDACVLSVDPAFVVYASVAKMFGMPLISVPLDAQFQIEVSPTLAAIEQHKPAVIFLAYPNNPTSNLFKPSDIQAVISAAPGVVVIDEAYQPFAGASWLSSGESLPDNVLVMRTLSKFGLAGLRLGYLVGSPALIGEFEKIRMPYNVNTLSLATATFALKHHKVFDAQAEDILQERARLEQAFGAFSKLQRFHSDANFILIYAQGHAQELFDHLLGAGIRIKNLSSAGGSLADCLRVTVGLRSENDSLLAAMETFYS